MKKHSPENLDNLFSRYLVDIRHDDDVTKDSAFVLDKLECSQDHYRRPLKLGQTSELVVKNDT